jgi:hypothetical protein
MVTSVAWVRAGGKLRLAIGPQYVNAHALNVNTEHTAMPKTRQPRGRPRKKIQDRPFQMRISEQFLRTVDEWRRSETDIPSRTEAIRRMVEFAARARKKQE